jgi:YVTN family beta-propeller protein
MQNDEKIQRTITFFIILYCIALVFISPSLTYAQKIQELHQLKKSTMSSENAHIELGGKPRAIGVIRDRIYVTIEPSNSTSVIEATNSTKIADIKVGEWPVGIGVNKATDTVYVANAYNDSVSIIDGLSNTKIGDDIKVGDGPRDIAVNEATDTVYVANAFNVSIIGKPFGDNFAVADIKVGSTPDAIAVNEATGTVYVTNYGSNTISVIDGNANKLVAGVTFDAKPFNAGHIECYKERVIAPTEQQFYLWSGSECTAKPNEGFEFVSWQENLGRNSTQLISVANPTSFFDSILDFLHLRPDKPESKLNITKFGSFTANFKALPPPIPPEYVATLFTVVATAFVGSWLTPAVIGWRKAKKEGGRVQTHHLVIKSIYDDGKVDEKDLPHLDKLKDDIMDDYANGNISEQHYTNLNNKVSVLYEEIYKKKIDLLNGKDANGALLDKVKDEINDSYAKGKISEQHYKLLNEKLSDNKNNQQSNNDQLASSSQRSMLRSTAKGSPIKNTS